MSRVLVAAVSLATAITIAGCGSDGGTPDRAAAPAPQPTRTHTPRPTPAPEPTPSVTPSRPDGHHKVGTLAPRTRAAAAVHLLDADRLPALGGRTWTVGPDTDPGAVGACQKTALDSIGAVDTVSRTFAADDGLAATQVVARFADSRSAWRAHEVLASWRDDCEARVKDATVGPLEPVTVRSGTADSYRGSYPRSQAAGLGILRSGPYLTLVEVAAGRAAYPSSWDPARVAVRRIARTF